MNDPVLIIERWPDLPGWPGRTTARAGCRKAVSEDGEWWLVRERGMFNRWRWRPRHGMYVTIQLVACGGTP